MVYIINHTKIHTTWPTAPRESARLDAVWNVRRTRDDKSMTGHTSVQEKVRHEGYEGLAAAHSRAVARLSWDIAEAVRTLEDTSR